MVLVGQSAQAQGADTILVRVEDRTRIGPRNRIVMRDVRSGIDREIYRTQSTQGHLPYPVSVSEDGRYLAFKEVVGQTDDGKIRLTVLDRSGTVVAALGSSSIWAARGIRDHLWCCGPHVLALVVGALAPSELPSGESTHLPAGVVLIDLSTGATLAHIPGLRSPQQVSWAAFDSSLYIKDVPNVPAGTPGPVTWPIYRYHVPSRHLTRSTHVGVFFSPDGRFYIDTGVGEGSGSFHLYRTDTDQDVTGVLGVPLHRLGREDGWLPNAGHTLVFIEQAPPPPRDGPRLPVSRMAPGTSQVYPDRWNLLADAETGKMVDRFQGDIGAGWKSYPPMLPVERRSGVELVRVPQ